MPPPLLRDTDMEVKLLRLTGIAAEAVLKLLVSPPDLMPTDVCAVIRWW